MPSQQTAEDIVAESLAPLQAEHLWPVAKTFNWEEAVDEPQGLDVNIIWSGKDTFAELGTNGGVFNGREDRDPEEVRQRRIWLARTAVSHRRHPFSYSDKYMSSLRDTNEIVSLMERLMETEEIVTSAKALGEMIKEHRRISYEQQVVFFNGLVPQEDRVMLKLVEETRSRQANRDRDIKLASLKGFFLISPEADGRDGEEQDFSVGVILGDQEDRLGVEPDGYKATGVFIPSRPASWLSPRI